ncbi:MAG: hypothetical protein GY771_08295, partial [bacterium]|nr:hypothetical protein [bacterium]
MKRKLFVDLSTIDEVLCYTAANEQALTGRLPNLGDGSDFPRDIKLQRVIRTDTFLSQTGSNVIVFSSKAGFVVECPL